MTGGIIELFSDSAKIPTNLMVRSTQDDYYLPEIPGLKVQETIQINGFQLKKVGVVRNDRCMIFFFGNAETVK